MNQIEPVKSPRLLFGVSGWMQLMVMSYLPFNTAGGDCRLANVRNVSATGMMTPPLALVPRLAMGWLGAMFSPAAGKPEPKIRITTLLPPGHGAEASTVARVTSAVPVAGLTAAVPTTAACAEVGANISPAAVRA